MNALLQTIYTCEKYRKMSWLLLYLLLTATPLSGQAQKYYVTPTPPPNPACPSDKPCHTLSYYASNALSLIDRRDNVSLLFIDGFYNYSDTVLEIANVNNLTMAGTDSPFDTNAPSTAVIMKLRN